MDDVEEPASIWRGHFSQLRQNEMAMMKPSCDRLPRMKAVGLLTLLILLAACNAGSHVVVHEEEDTSPATKAAPPSNWEYKTEGDTSWACAHSVDNAAELCFRREHGRLDAYLHLPSLEGNPFFCARKHCDTKIQFDAAAEQTLHGTDDERGGTRILFLPAPDKLLDEIKRAKQIRLSPPMFGVDQRFVFKVDGLKWP